MAMTSEARLLVTVKAQPALSTKHGEVVCVAGVRLDRPTPEWIRLFPVGFRDLDRALQFTKYQEMTVRVTRPRNDGRAESYTPDMNSVHLGAPLDTGPRGSWGRRWDAIRGLADVVTMCELNRGQREGRPMPSLAMIRPAEVLDVDVVDAPDFTNQQRILAAAAADADLFGPARQALEPPPFEVRYHWRCADAGCSTHHQKCIDWEVGQAGRKWLADVRDREVVRRQMKEKWLSQLCASTRDTYFFVGNQHQHPQSYMVLGVFWPPHDPGRLQEQLTLL